MSFQQNVSMERFTTVSKSESIRSIAKRCSPFQFVRIVCSDVHGISRGKLVPVSKLEEFLVSGGLSLRVVTLEGSHEKVEDRYMIPDLDTFHACPWAGNESGVKVAQMLGLLYVKRPFAAHPSDIRTLCWRTHVQLKKEFGLKLYSAFNYRFTLVDNSDGKIDGHKTPGYSTLDMKKKQSYLFEVYKNLEQAGIQPRTLAADCGKNQLSISVSPALGITGADNAFIVKQCTKETAVDFNKTAIFMAKPFDEMKLRNQGPFNFSLYDYNGDNAFYDKDKVNEFSQIALWFLGGVMKHAQAMCAFILPTRNCYQTTSLLPIAMGLERRDMMLRLKSDSSLATYAQFQSCSSVANPYLVFAAVLAAGLDGLRNKINPPPSSETLSEGSPKLPCSLEDAVKVLEADPFFTEAFGSEFVQSYIKNKNESELNDVFFIDQQHAYLKLM